LRFLETGGRVAFTASRPTFRKVRVAQIAETPTRSRRRKIPMSRVMDIFKSTDFYI
jgi:hypothetical protein